MKEETDFMYNDDTDLDTVSALDLTCKFDDEKLTSEINQRVDSSPVLMPPPSSILVKTMPSTSGPKIFPMTQSSKQVSGENVPVSKDGLLEFKKCSFPTKDVRCFITNNIESDPSMKRMVKYQISRKIYTRPEIYNTCATLKCCAEQFGIDITKSIRASASAMKINKNYF